IQLLGLMRGLALPSNVISPFFQCFKTDLRGMPSPPLGEEAKCTALFPTARKADRALSRKRSQWSLSSCANGATAAPVRSPGCVPEAVDRADPPDFLRRLYSARCPFSLVAQTGC